MSAAEQNYRRDAAHEAAVKRHATVPELKDLGRMVDEEIQIIEQHIADAAADDDAPPAEAVVPAAKKPATKAKATKKAAAAVPSGEVAS